MIKRIKTIWTENVPCIRSFQTRNALSDEFTLARAHWKPNPNEELSGTSVLRSSPKPVVGISKPALGFLYIRFDDHANEHLSGSFWSVTILHYQDSFCSIKTLVPRHESGNMFGYNSGSPFGDWLVSKCSGKVVGAGPANANMDRLYL